MSEKIVRLVIIGRVQGVGYRFFVESEANGRNVRGWVRNRRDGTVEVIVAGSSEAVDVLIAACWRGPAGSRVANVQVVAIGADDADLPSTGFTIRAAA